MELPEKAEDRTEFLLSREWLVTNGMGGYASGTLGGVVTRRYHGVLVAALASPLGRTVMLNHLTERLRLPDGSVVRMGGEERRGDVLDIHGHGDLEEFRLELGLPVWRYRFGPFRVERRVGLVHQQNTVFVTWSVLEGEGVLRLKLQPSLHFRGYEAPVDTPLGDPYHLTAVGGRFEVHGPRNMPPLRMRLVGSRPAFTLEERRLLELVFRVDAARGYDAAGELWSPGYLRADLCRGSDVSLVASTEPWEILEALTPDEAHDAERARREGLLTRVSEPLRTGPPGELVLAADQFIIVPAGRAEEAARAAAAGDEVRTVIAGYHWFTDWGRDTMISLEGLALVTGRHREAGYILRTFGHYVRDGLIPNMFPDGSSEGLYHTADATLWYFHALERYLVASGDRATLRRLMPRLRDILGHHLRGTRFGIGVDPEDGLLRQGAPGYQLTWMDALCDGWVVTPRRGKAVELNALWYNALRLMVGWLRAEGDETAAAELDTWAEKARLSFARRFWYEDGKHLYDVVDGESGDDPACRPNQLLAISLDHPVLDASRWPDVLRVVRDELVTPVGLRSLSPRHPDYKPTYHGDLRTRDAAYHQGTVWGWLVGPYVDAWLRTYPDDMAAVQRYLEQAMGHLDDFGVGSVAEVFDAEAPFTPRGCIAQAWSVAELLRCWARVIGACPYDRG